MGLIGGIIGGIGSAIGGIAGSKAARRAAERNEALIAEQEQQQKDWYEKEYNANFLERSDARAAIAKTRDLLSERYKQAEASAAVTGATDASLARQKAAANETLAEVTSNIAERADAHKDAVRANYEQQQQAILQQKLGVNNQKAQATMQAAQGMAGAAQSIGEGMGTDVDNWVGNLFKKKK